MGTMRDYNCELMDNIKAITGLNYSFIEHCLSLCDANNLDWDEIPENMNDYICESLGDLFDMCKDYIFANRWSSRLTERDVWERINSLTGIDEAILIEGSALCCESEGRLLLGAIPHYVCEAVKKVLETNKSTIYPKLL